MKKTIINCLILTSLMCSIKTFGQELSTEVTGMVTNWSATCVFNTKMNKESKLSFSNVSRISSNYHVNDEVPILMMTNIGYSVSPKLNCTMGGIYTSGSGLKPSLGLQYKGGKNHIIWMIFPNLNISKQPELMPLLMFQFLRKIPRKLSFVLRVQSLSLMNEDGHLFSSVRFRTGFIRGSYQFGAATDLNFFGNDFHLAHCYGLFLQCQIF